MYSIESKCLRRYALAVGFVINNTGIGAAPTNPDPNWTVTTSPTPGSTNAFVTDTGNYPFPIWLADTATYGWDSPQSSYGDGETDPAGTDFYYTTTFDLTGFDPTSASLQFQFAVDDDLVAVILNDNTLTGFPAGALGSLSATQTINTDFVSGVNTITFETFNQGGDPTPTGLLVDFTSATANTIGSAPEPSAFLLIGAGLGGLGLIRRRVQSR
jgi:hypothetical protein